MRRRKPRRVHRPLRRRKRNIRKHILHARHVTHAPARERTIKRGCPQEQTAHIGDRRGIPVAKWLIEGSRPLEHAAHIGDRRGIPVAD